MGITISEFGDLSMKFFLKPLGSAIVTERGVGILVFFEAINQSFPVWGMAVSRTLDAVCRFVQE